MTVSLEARRMIVTGASSGIGRTIVKTVARHGASIVAVARREDELQALVAESDGPGLIVPLAMDVTAEDAAQKIVEHAVTALGGIDVLVNAAGYGFNAPSESVPPSDWDDLFAVNVNAVAHLTAAALPQLIESAERKGVASDVVTLSSTAGLSGAVQAAAYSGSKYAVRGLMDAWRLEYASRDVRFGTIFPGAVDTEFGRDQATVREWYDDAKDDGAMLEAQDIADAVEFLLAQPARASISEITLRPTRQV